MKRQALFSRQLAYVKAFFEGAVGISFGEYLQEADEALCRKAAIPLLLEAIQSVLTKCTTGCRICTRRGVVVPEGA
ncbi:MAG TPA: hypothetical protein VNJ09_03350 [Chthonomonadales bacterium]|nr:hypothetical protein [Chthonomonadales bacterium]